MTDMKPLAVVTGAASGIGAGLAREAAARGYRLLLADWDGEGVAALAAGLNDAHVLTIDVTDAAAVEALATKADTLGGTDLLFNNAGVMTTGLSWEIPADAWARALAINLGGILNGLRSFVPRMIARGTPCRIVNTASVGGFLPSPLMAPYSVTKFGVVALTESLKLELAMLGAPVEVSLLAPGPVHSAIFDDPFAGTVHPATEQFVGMMRDLLGANGIEPDAFASRVFDAIRRGDYWIVPQPEALDAALEARHDMIRTRGAPDLSTLG